MKKLIKENILKLLSKISKISLAIIPLIILIVGLAINDWLVERFVLFYFLPIVIVAIYWFILRLKIYDRVSKSVLIIDALVLISAIFRIFGYLPFSGHMIFLTYGLVSTSNRTFRIITFLVIIETTYLKLFIWNDILSWTLGGIIGLILGIGVYFTNMPDLMKD